MFLLLCVILLSAGSSLKEVGAQQFSTYDQFREAVTSNFPGAEPSWEQYNNFNNYARSEGSISDQQEAAMALAQFLHESWGLRLKRECVAGSWGNPPPCQQCYNGHPQCGGYVQDCDVQGQMYFGRGYIHLTWSCDNYAPCSEALFGDRNVLLNNPDLVSDDDTISWRSTFWYWRDRVHDYPGVQQGQFGASTNAINGPLECGPNPQNPDGARIRYDIYKNVRRAWGLPGDGDPSGCN